MTQNSSIIVRSAEHPDGAVLGEVSDVTEDNPAPEQSEQKDTDSGTVKPGEKDQENLESEDNLSEEDEDDQDESGKSESEDKDKNEKFKSRKKGGFQRRIDKLNSRISERDREIEYLKSIAFSKKEQEGQKEQNEPSNSQNNRISKKESEGRPDANDYDSYDDYIEALVDWKSEKKLEHRERLREQDRQKSEYEKTVSQHQERLKSFRESHPDFDDYLEEIKMPISPAVESLLIGSEKGPELMYALAKNVKEYERINSLPPVLAAMELGKFSAQFLNQSTPGVGKSKITNAPAPINTVKGGGRNVEKRIDDPSLSQAEYERLRRKQMSQK